jgi:hypothetical protein
MIDLLKFIFSNIWYFLGTVALIIVLGDVVEGIVKILKR